MEAKQQSEARRCCVTFINEQHSPDCPKAPKIEIRDCCVSSVDEAHRDDCPVMKKLDDSFKQDGQRWIEGYVENNTEAVRKRAVRGAMGLNGKSYFHT